MSVAAAAAAVAAAAAESALTKLMSLPAGRYSESQGVGFKVGIGLSVVSVGLGGMLLVGLLA